MSRRKYNHQYYLKNKDKWKNRKRDKEKQKEYSDRYFNKHRIRCLINSLKRSAERRGLDFNLNKEDIIIPNKCPILNIPLKFGSPKYNSPSIDRFDNSKGYTKDNIRVISYRANVLKNDATLEEMEAIINYMKENST